MRDPVRRRAEAAGAGVAAARARTRCCCSTSPTTTWTCRASSGWRSSSPRRPRPCCWSATTGSCWPRCAERIVTVEDGNVWVHGGGFATYAQARRERNERLDELRRRWDEEHEKLKAAGADVQAEGHLQRRHGLAATRPRRPGCASSRRRGRRERRRSEQNVRMRLRGGRTGKRAVICEQLELTGLMQPFDLEVWYGERVAVLGSNGSGKSHFLRLLAGRATSAHHRRRPGSGARVVPGTVRADPRPADLPGRTPLEILMTEHALLQQRGDVGAGPLRAAALRASSRSTRCPAASRPGCRSCCWSWPAPRCCCWTSPPTTSTWPAPRRCRRAWSPTTGTVLAVTHDRWFARSFDRFVVFGRVARCMRRPSRSGMRLAWSGNADRSPC